MFALGLWLNSSLRVGADLRLKSHREGQRASISCTRVRLREGSYQDKSGEQAGSTQPLVVFDDIGSNDGLQPEQQ
jgi:hypothetical protein